MLHYVKNYKYIFQLLKMEICSVYREEYLSLFSILVDATGLMLMLRKSQKQFVIRVTFTVKDSITYCIIF